MVTLCPRPQSTPRHYSWALVVFTQSNPISVLVIMYMYICVYYGIYPVLGDDLAVVVFVWLGSVPLATYCPLHVLITSSDEQGRKEGALVTYNLLLFTFRSLPSAFLLLSASISLPVMCFSLLSSYIHQL